MLLNDKRRFMAETGSGMGAGGPVTDNPAGTEVAPSENATLDETNNENKDGNFSTLWDNESSEKDANAQTQQVSPAPAGDVAKPDEVFADHVKSLELTKGIDMNVIANDMASGKTESLQDAFNAVASNVYKATMLTANKLTDAKISAAVDDAVNQSDGRFRTDLAIRELNDQLPFTAKPEIAPIAKGIFGQFIKKGKSVDEAITSTRDFFAHTMKLSAKDVGVQLAPKGSSSFRNSNSGITPDDADEGNVDFEALLKGLSD